MLCHALVLILIAQVTHPTWTYEYVTSSPLIATIDRIREKLENLTVEQTFPEVSLGTSHSDEDEVLTGIQTWGNLTPEQMKEIARDHQKVKAAEEDRRRLSDLFYEDNDEEYTDIDYRNDGEDDDELDTPDSLTKLKHSKRPYTFSDRRPDSDDQSSYKRPYTFDDRPDSDDQSSYNRPYTLVDDGRPDSDDQSGYKRPYTLVDDGRPDSDDQPGYKRPYTLVDDGRPDPDDQLSYNDDRSSPVSQRPDVISAVEPMRATNERPRILYDSDLPRQTLEEYRMYAIKNLERVYRDSKCSEPQRKWLTVSHLLPGSNIVLTPNYVDLHRCTTDSGCCPKIYQICAPIEGRHVKQHFYLQTREEEFLTARVVFYNHTKCGCVNRTTLQSDATQLPVVSSTPAPIKVTVEPKSEEDVTKPPQIKRCTCPTPFLATTSNGVCTCGCTWRDVSHRHDCQYISRGKEHLGLRDRVCIENGDCDPPACEYGAYDAKKGKCPKSKKRDRFHEKRLHQERNVV